jgi:protein O-mannosyl-transferase
MAVLYGRTIRTPYFFDDLQAFGGDLNQVSLPSLDAIWSPQSRPVLQAWFWLISQWGEHAVVAYRTSGLLIHVVNCFLAYHLVRILTTAFDNDEKASEQGTSRERRSEWIGFSVAAIWLIHPVVPQTVCAIVQQAESIATMFLILYLILIAKLQSWGRWKVAILLQVILLLGLYTKFIVIAAVPAGLLLDAMLQRKSIWSTLRTSWLLHLPPVVAALIAVVLLAPTLIQAEAGVGFGGEAPPVIVYLMTSAKSFVHYLWLAFFPIHLSIDRSPRWIITAQESLPWFILCWAYISIGIWLWCRSSQTNHPNSRFIAWLLFMPIILLLPTSSFVPTADSFFEHRIYFAIVFWVWMALEVCDRLISQRSINHRRRVQVYAGIVVVTWTMLTVRTYFRTIDYATPEAIWRSALEVDPDNSRAAQNFVAAMQIAGLENAIQDSLIKVAANAERQGYSFHATVHQLAKTEIKNGQPESALQILQQLRKTVRKLEDCITVRQRREFGEVWFDLALALSQLGNPHDALAALDNTIKASPNDPIVHQFRGDLFHRLGDNDRAQESWSKSQKLWTTIPGNSQ